MSLSSYLKNLSIVGTAAGGGGGGTVISLPTFSATSDDALPTRAMVYIKASGNCALADATAEGKEAIGYVTTAVNIGQAATISLPGTVVTGYTGLTPGVRYYLSTTPGAIVAQASAPSAAGNVLMKVGTALSATALLFAPEAPITL